MRLPARLSRHKKDVHKNTFGHVLVLAGSPPMLGAAALTALAAMRAGAGLVTAAVPRSLNLALQKKLSPVVMTWALDKTKEGALSFKAYPKIKKAFHKFDVIALGPGLSQDPSTQKLIRKIIETSPLPLVIDADALNALAGHLNILRKNHVTKILTPHIGELSRILRKDKKVIESAKLKVISGFVKSYDCVLLLKGHRTLVGAPGHKIYVNKTGNPGMATAGSGDVLTGIIAAFLAQELSGFEAARLGAYIHGKAGDLAAQKISKQSLIASDIIHHISDAFKKSR